MANVIKKIKVSDTTYPIDRIYNLFSGITTVDGNGTSGEYLSVRWYITGGIDGITAPYDGMKIAIKVPLAGVSTAGAMLSINGNTDTQYHPVVYNKNTAFTTHFPVDSIKIFIYDATATMTCYKTSNTKSTVTGVWKGESDYNSNSTSYLSYTAGAVSSGTTKNYIIGKPTVASSSTNKYNADVYFENDGTLNAPELSEGGVSLSSKYLAQSSTSGLVKNDGTIDTNSYYLASNPNGYTSNVGTVTSVNNTSPDSNGNVTLTIPTPDYPVTDVKIGTTSIVSSKVATIQTNSTYNASTNKIATMSDLPTVPTTYLESASANGNTLTITPHSGSAVVFTPTFTEQHIGDVVSVSATSGSNIAIGGTTANPTVGVASGYSIPSNTKQAEWDVKPQVINLL